MRVIFRLLQVTLVLTLAGAAAAQTSRPADPAYTAGTLALQCAGVPTTDDPAASRCMLRIDSFIQGWRAGAVRGVAQPYIHDAAVGQTVEGSKDLFKRIAALRPTARCMPENIGLFDVAPMFVQYVRANPTRAQERWDLVLSDSLQDTYCK